MSEKKLVVLTQDIPLANGHMLRKGDKYELEKDYPDRKYAVISIPDGNPLVVWDSEWKEA